MGPRWLALSLAAHGAVIGLLFAAYRGFVMRSGGANDVVAVALVVPQGRHAAPPPAGRPAPAQTRLTAPNAIPTAIPVPAAKPDSIGQSSGVPGGTGIAISPFRGDPRLWVTPMYIPEGGGRPIDMDSVVRRRMMFMATQMDSAMKLDSLNPNKNPLATPRWTFERDGKTYGIDQQGIHFGTFSIPTAVLALLPFPQGNIDGARAYQRMLDMRGDILRAAARAEAEDDFRRAVAQIRERKDRERREERERRDRERRDSDRPIP